MYLVVERADPMSLDSWQKLSQIVFYVIITVVTVLTFLRARKGLLSTVNTEYHKKVIERLDELSRTLLDEYDFESPNHWSRFRLGEDAVKEINSTFLAHKADILKTRKFPPGIRTAPEYTRLSNLVPRVKSDPFIPGTIRNQVVDLLENRAHVIIEVHLMELEKYRTQLATGTYKGDPKNTEGVIHNRILEGLRLRGCGIPEMEQEVHNVRLGIQKYFARYHP